MPSSPNAPTPTTITPAADPAGVYAVDFTPVLRDLSAPLARLALYRLTADTLLRYGCHLYANQRLRSDVQRHLALANFNMRAYINKDLVEAYPDILLDTRERDRLIHQATDVVLQSVSIIDSTLRRVLGDYPGRLYFDRLVMGRLAVFTLQPD